MIEVYKISSERWDRHGGIVEISIAGMGVYTKDHFKKRFKLYDFCDLSNKIALNWEFDNYCKLSASDLMMLELIDTSRNNYVCFLIKKEDRLLIENLGFNMMR